MNRKHFFAWLLVMLVMLTTLPVRQAAAEQIFSYDFEQSLKPWAAASSRDGCVNSKTLQLALDDADSMGPAKNQYAALTSDCVSNTWMVTTLETNATAFTVQFDARRVAGCVGCIPLVYVGSEMPGYPGQFKTDFSYIADKWQPHKYALSLSADHTGKVIVALAFTNLDMESARERGPGASATIGFDNIRVTPFAEKCPECD